MDVIKVVLTLNYEDLQNIRKHLQKKQFKNSRKIYDYIEMYKETLNFMYNNNLAQNKSKETLEHELCSFAKNLLSNTNKTYKQLEEKYQHEININDIKSNEIKLKI